MKQRRLTGYHLLIALMLMMLALGAALVITGLAQGHDPQLPLTERPLLIVQNGIFHG